MPRENTEPQLAGHIRGACLAGALAAAVVAAAAQSPTSPRLTGEAPAPASTLSLWYRTPASDHPLLSMAASREIRQAASAEWVRALPVGNGRLGAMVFGGIVHERLQLNEDTLWAGRPYDPVNPDAKDALPEVRRLLAERKYCEAAKLVEAKRDVEAARADAVPDRRRSGADVPGGRFRRELPARARPHDGDGSRVLHQRWRDVLARGVRERPRPGHRRAADRQPSRTDLLRRPGCRRRSARRWRPPPAATS